MLENLTWGKKEWSFQTRHLLGTLNYCQRTHEGLKNGRARKLLEEKLDRKCFTLSLVYFALKSEKKKKCN